MFGPETGQDSGPETLCFSACTQKMALGAPNYEELIREKKQLCALAVGTWTVCSPAGSSTHGIL